MWEKIQDFQTLIVFFAGSLVTAGAIVLAYFKTLRKRSVENETRSKDNEQNISEIQKDLKQGREEVKECFREIRKEIKSEFEKFDRKLDSVEKKNEEDHARVLDKMTDMQKEISETNGQVKVLTEVVLKEK